MQTARDEMQFLSESRHSTGFQRNPSRVRHCLDHPVEIVRQCAKLYLDLHVNSGEQALGRQRKWRGINRHRLKDKMNGTKKFCQIAYSKPAWTTDKCVAR